MCSNSCPPDAADCQNPKPLLRQLAMLVANISTRMLVALFASPKISKTIPSTLAKGDEQPCQVCTDTE